MNTTNSYQKKYYGKKSKKKNKKKGGSSKHFKIENLHDDTLQQRSIEAFIISYITKNPNATKEGLIKELRDTDHPDEIIKLIEKNLNERLINKIRQTKFSDKNFSEELREKIFSMYDEIRKAEVRLITPLAPRREPAERQVFVSNEGYGDQRRYTGNSVPEHISPYGELSIGDFIITLPSRTWAKIINIIPNQNNTRYLVIEYDPEKKNTVLYSYLIATRDKYNWFDNSKKPPIKVVSIIDNSIAGKRVLITNKDDTYYNNQGIITIDERPQGSNIRLNNGRQYRFKTTSYKIIN